MDVENQSALDARAPKLRGERTAGEAAHQLLLLQEYNREQRSKRVLRRLGWSAVYTGAALAGLKSSYDFAAATPTDSTGKPENLYLDVSPLAKKTGESRMNDDNQSALYARTPRLRGDLSPGELAYARLLREHADRRQLTYRILRILGWIAAYLVGAIAGVIISVNIAFSAADKGGDSGSPAGIVLAGAIVGFGGLVVGLLFVGLVQLSVFLFAKILGRQRRSNEDALER